jgi:hypothetical protein
MTGTDFCVNIQNQSRSYLNHLVHANKMQHFLNLIWQKTLHVSDRLTVHHQESQYCIHINCYLSYR